MGVKVLRDDDDNDDDDVFGRDGSLGGSLGGSLDIGARPEPGSAARASGGKFWDPDEMLFWGVGSAKRWGEAPAEWIVDAAGDVIEDHWVGDDPESDGEKDEGDDEETGDEDEDEVEEEEEEEEEVEEEEEESDIELEGRRTAKRRRTARGGGQR